MKTIKNFLAGTLCAMMILENVIPAGFQVSASEHVQIESAIDEGTESSAAGETMLKKEEVAVESEGVRTEEKEETESYTNSKEDRVEETKSEEVRETESSADSKENKTETAIETEEGQTDEESVETESKTVLETEEISDEDEEITEVDEKNLDNGSSVEASGKCGDNLTWKLEDGTLTISGTGEMYDYSTGNSDRGRAPWYEYNSVLKRLILEDGITRIGYAAFYQCNSFGGELIIPDSVTTIGSYAFQYCSGFTGDLIIPNSVTDIGSNGTFEYCSGFTGNLTIGSSVEKIGDSAFTGCKGFTGDLIIPDSVTEIGPHAFYGCSGFNGNLIMSNNVVTIKSAAFYHCSGFTGNLIIPSSVNEISSNAFSGCENINNMVFMGDAPKLSVYTFVSFTAQVYYPLNKSGWESVINKNYGGTLTWIPYTEGTAPWELPYEPEDPPTDINQNDITVNGKGYAYANFTLKNNTGQIQRNAKITYIVDGKSYEAVSDNEGHIALKSPLLENTTGKNEKKTIVAQNITLHYSSGKTETLDYKVTMNVIVTPLSFTQTWKLGTKGSLEGSFGPGAGVTVGVAQAEIDLAKAKLKGSAGGTLSVEHSFEDGHRNLVLRQNYESKVAAKAKVGPAAQASFLVLGQDLDIDIAEAGAGIVSGKSVGIGLKIDNYNPDDTAQIADIGKFMLGAQAQAGGNMMMLKLAEQAGFDFWNLEQCGADISFEANADVGSIEFGGKSVGTLASVGSEQMTGYTIKRDKTDSSKQLAFEHELAAAASVGAIGIVGLQKDIFSRSDNHNLQISAKLDAGNQVENVTIKIGEKSAQGFMQENGTAESVAVTYDREALKEIQQDISVIGDFISGSIQYIFGDAQEDLYKQLDLLPVKGSYLAAKTDQVKIKVDFEIGLKLGVGVNAGIGLEGVQSCEYETAGGTYEGGQRYITNTNEIEEAVKENSYSIDQLVGEPLKTIGERFKDFLNDNSDKLTNGVKNGLAVIDQVTLGPASQWMVHIVSLNEGKTKSADLQSYEITAYTTTDTSGRITYGAAETNEHEYKAFTVGDPYYVYVTDALENEIMDYSAQPLTLELSYTDEMLTNAGFTGAEINNIAVYMYSQEFCGYVCVGGVVNAETKTVSVEITKPGQYVLAVDSIAPTVKSITVSQNTNKPLIIVEFDEISGFREFSMKLDNEEVIATANWNKYYNKVYNSFSYQVEKELADGKHSCSVYAVDTAGNAMPASYEAEFYIGNPSKDDIASGSYENVRWRIDINGKLFVEGNGDFANPNLAYSGDRAPWSDYKDFIKSAEVNLKGVTKTSFMFYGCKNLVNIDIKQFDTSNVTNMSWMFQGCSSLISVDVGGFDTEKVTDMCNMFHDCSSLTNVNVSGFDTRNVLDMEGMFGGCSNLASVDVSGFDTGNATDMRFMFYGCSGLTSLDVSGFDTGKVMDMGWMFYGCRNLASLDMSSFDMGSVTEADFFISGCNRLTSIYVPRNCHIDGLQLPNSHGAWHDFNGNEYNNLPNNMEESILLFNEDYTDHPVEKITVRKTQTIYHCGDTISMDDVIVMYYTKDGTVKKVLNFTTNASDIDMTTLGKKTLTITYISENGNETAPLTASVTIIVTYSDVKISGIEIGDSVYNKTPVSYTGTAKVTSEMDNTDLTNAVKLTYTYSGTQADGSAYAAAQTAPVNAGNYKLTVAVAKEDQTYAGSAEYPFKIAKAPLTVTARDIGLKIGAELPKAEDYKYDTRGLFEGDKLTKEPEFACSIASTAEAGTYEITVSGADAGMNYEITYKNGTLTVSENGETTKYYTVTFNLSSKGSDIINTGVKEGSLLEKPQDPQVEGYSFTGWYKDPSCTDKWDFAKDTIQSDTTLYAGWTKKSEGGDDNKDEDKDDSQYTDEERTDLSSAAIANIKVKTYDGNAYEPAVKIMVKSGGKTTTLIEGTDYRVLYNNNVNAGQNAEVIIKGNGIYKGSLSKKYTISPKSVKKLKIVTGGMSNAITVSESNLSTLPVYVYDGTKLLKYNTDYTLSNYSVSKSTAKVIVTGVGNYTGAITAKITLYSVDNDRIINSENVSLVTDTVPYTGKAVKNIEPIVIVGTTTLTKNKDYKIQYTNNTNAGTAFVIVTGKGTYKGKVVKPFTIKAATVTSEQVTIKPISAKTYNRKLQKPAVTVTVPNGTKTKKLTQNKDYAITYKNNLHVGKATVVITGRGNYKGMEARAEFTINPQKISKASVKGTQGNITLTYAGRVLREGSDYEIPIYGEVKKNKIKVTIKGKGDFTGEMTKSVKIP